MTHSDYERLTTEIAVLLDGTATPQFANETTRSGRFRISLPGEPNAVLVLAFSPRLKEGRLEVITTFPMDPVGGGHTGSRYYTGQDVLDRLGFVDRISVSLTKTAEQIARDIQRRLLPAYLTVLATANVCNTERLIAHNEKIETLKRLAGIVGVLPDEQVIKRERFSLYDHKTSRSIDVTMTNDTQVSMDLKWITPALAERILKLIMKEG